ncbi:MAG TPA: C45 family peptidase [Armatimonadota bacterium]|nr:C45 family peptidase [Armatimonadota bacterium]
MEPLVLSGTCQQQGRQHGAAMGEPIRRILADVMHPEKWDRERVGRYLDLLEDNMQRLCPQMLEEMRGIAEGAQIPYRDILAYNCIADIGAVNAYCTNIAFQSTPDGPAIGKTNDIGRNLQHYHVVFRRDHGDGQPLLWVTWPGTVWANCFVNGSGLAFGGASVATRLRNEEGIPSNVMLRLAGDMAADVEEATRLLRETAMMHASLNITLADASGSLAVVEKAPDGCEVRQPDERGVLFATNHFCTPGLVGTDTPELASKLNSERRFENLRRLTAGGEQTVERLQRLLADHTDPGAICQHGQQEMWTTVAYVVVPRTRALYFAYGRPCETPFEEFRL